MRYKFLFTILLLCCFLLPESKALAQQPSFKLFFEKVYLHFDRSYYSPGDNIWFKAYLVNPQTNAPANTSHNLYVELIDPGGDVVAKEVLRLDNGTGAGDLILGDSIPAGPWHIRAYTNWMKNFGGNFIFERTIWVHDPATARAMAASSSAARDAAYRASAAAKPAARSSAGPTSIQFLPEGGAMVEGVPGMVCFKATDGNGDGVDTKGYILSSKGDTAARFTTEHRGMGRFPFLPAAGLEYTARVSFAGHAYQKTAFPPAYKEGLVMNITPSDTAEIVNIATNTATTLHHPSGEITVTGRQAGKLYYGEKILLKDGQASVTLPKKNFPAGIAAITVYDDQLHPQCERLVYIEEREPVSLVITTDRRVYSPREKITIGISVTDTAQHPVRAALSMTVAEDVATGPAQRDIISYLMLESELQGKIEAATEYFDKDNSRRRQQLDLLLSTQGWNSFLWRKLADTSIRVAWLPEAGFTIAGHVRQTLINRPLANMNITLFAAGALGDRRYAVRTNTDGRYFIDGLQWYGYQTIQINSKNDKGEKGGWLFMDTVFSTPPPFDRSLLAESAYPAEMQRFATAADKKVTASKDVFHSTLPGVTVTNQSDKVVHLRDQVATSFGYPEYNFLITPKDYTLGTVGNFIIHNVPGAQADVARNGVVFFANGRKVRPRFIVNKREDLFGHVDYYDISMDRVNKISVRHMIGQPNFSANGRGSISAEDGRDIFLVYLDLKPGAVNDDLAFITTQVEGYYSARTFYSPDYSKTNDAGPDTRTTLHWAPNIQTDGNGKTTVSFYNADPATTIRVNVQGVTEDGVPVAATLKYEIK